jgi:hypothetical protein
MAGPGRADFTSARLDAGVEASGPHDFAVRSKHLSSAIDRSRAETRPAITSRAKRCRVHRIPPRVRDDRDTPLCGDETAGVLEVIWVRREQKPGVSFRRARPWQYRPVSLPELALEPPLPIIAIQQIGLRTASPDRQLTSALPPTTAHRARRSPAMSSQFRLGISALRRRPII